MKILPTLVAIGVLSGGPALAHHSFAPYETTLQIKMSGLVTGFRWANPHVYIELDAEDAKTGEKRHWLVECASTSILNRAGWKFNVIKPGDSITVLLNPLKNGDPGGMLETVTLADGRTLTDSNPPGGVFQR